MVSPALGRLTKFQRQSQSPAIIIANNYRRNQEFDESAAEWVTFKTLDSSSGGYTMCGAWYELVELGSSVVAHAMLRYYDDMFGWWDELLCELISGHRSGAMIFFRPQLHERWIRWFESETGESEAPYKLIGEAASFELQLRANGRGHPSAELA